jgi:hypothetical protein
MSNEKQFKLLEDKIRTAAQINQPQFNEAAWEKMEMLLDNDKKHRPFIWLWTLLPLIITGIAGINFLNVSDAESGKKIVASNVQVNQISNTAVAPLSITDVNIKDVLPDENLQNKTLPATNFNADINTSVIKKIPLVINSRSKENYTSVPGRKIVSGSTAKKINQKHIGEEDITDGDYKKITENVEDQYSIKIKSALPETDDQSEQKTTAKITDSLTAKRENQIAEQTEPPANKKTDASPKKQKIKEKGFYLLPTAGVDISSTKLFHFKNNHPAVKFGLAAGYRFNKRLSAQAGMYISRKKYLAAREDYSVKAGSYWTVVEVVKIDANCLVYEIPVSFRYDVLRRKKAIYFAGAGVSSYIMKKEDYNYFYIKNYMLYNRTGSYTGNKKFFSNLNFYAGVEKKINEKLSLIAEPSVSIPLSGVGDGKVKIYSAALQLGFKYFPFKKKNK